MIYENFQWEVNLLGSQLGMVKWLSKVTASPTFIFLTLLNDENKLTDIMQIYSLNLKRDVAAKQKIGFSKGKLCSQQENRVLKRKTGFSTGKPGSQKENRVLNRKTGFSKGKLDSQKEKYLTQLNVL